MYGGYTAMIQPVDIRSQTFKKGLFGYNKVDVDSFKDTVYKAYEDVIKENTKLSEEVEKLKKTVEDSRLKIFDLEKKANSGSGAASSEDEAKAKKIIEEAQKSAAEILARAKAEGDRIVSAAGGAAGTATKAEAPKTEVKPDQSSEDKRSAASKFFEEEKDKMADLFGADDDEVFVGEIEDNRKPSKVMIGDGEEEEDADFEFL